MSILQKDWLAFAEKFEKEHGFHMNQVSQHNLTFELKQSRRLKWPDVELDRPGGGRKITVSIEDAEFMRKAYLEVKSAYQRVYRESHLREDTFKQNVNCSICGDTLKGEDYREVVDAFKYDFDGELDSIELYHRACATAKFWTIDSGGHVKGRGPRTGVKEAVQRKEGKFIVVDKRGKQIGEPHPSYSSAQKADQGRNRFDETSDQSVGVNDMRITEASEVLVSDNECLTCDGTGTVEYDFRCPDCKGTGKHKNRIKEARTLCSFSSYARRQHARH